MSIETAGRWVYANGVRVRLGTYPPHWGQPPTLADSHERRAWIASNVRHDTDPYTVLAAAALRDLNNGRQAQLLALRHGPS